MRSPDSSGAVHVRFPTPPPARRVVVAEDDREMRRLIVSSLRRGGYEIREVADGRELLKVLENITEDEADLVVTDVRMPGVTGLDALTALRTRNVPLPAIVITAFGDAATHARARSLGAVAVLDKPFDVEDLERAVRRALGRGGPGHQSQTADRRGSWGEEDTWGAES